MDEYELPSATLMSEIKRFNTNDNQTMTVGYEDEYLTLYIDGVVITQGEYEVLNRVKQVNRENGYNWI